MEPTSTSESAERQRREATERQPGEPAERQRREPAEQPRREFIGAAAALLASAALPAGAAEALVEAAAGARSIMNDASRLNPTPVFSHWIVKPSAEAEIIARLRRELKAAAAQRRPLVVGAARHSMGGQSLARNGTGVTFDIDRVELDRSAGLFRAHAGTRWHQVIAQLDPAGFSPAVMQSNADFGVAATFAVNAHGWPTPYGPFGATVRALRMMLADGTIVTCSRSENAELFGLAMGGYGLFGILLDLEVEMVENQLLRPRFEVMPARDFAAAFVRAADRDPLVRMMYGRLNVTRADFLGEALLVTYRPAPAPPGGLPPASREGALTGVSRKVYRAQIGSEAAKRARWLAETVAAPKAGAGLATRNTLMNEPAANLASADRRRTDILHEYFVPPERFDAFLAACREIIPRARAEFLNVTLRHVLADPVSAMAHSPTRRIAAVMSFSQEVTPEAEAEMLVLTEALIDRVAALGGSFYLPYRLHARRDQVERVYPNSARFAERKRHYDRDNVFRHAMWDAYFA